MCIMRPVGKRFHQLPKPVFSTFHNAYAVGVEVLTNNRVQDVDDTGVIAAL